MKTALRLAGFALSLASACFVSEATAQSVGQTQSTAPPKVGDQAPTVTLQSVAGESVDLSETFAHGKTVLVVLRGYPGYQCGICSRTASGFIRDAAKFAEAGVEVVMIYPGEAAGLNGRADEFLGGKTLPEPLTMLLDPDYELVNAYGIRWDAPRETAYPSTFVVGEGGEILFAKISSTHGGRAGSKAVQQALDL